MPQTKIATPLEEALARRRSVREFSSAPLEAAHLAQLLWAAQGVTSPSGGRTAPSAGATYPMEVYAANADGLFHYLPSRNVVVRVREGDLRSTLSSAALGQDCVREAAAVIVLTGVPARTELRYGPRAMRYVHMEAGHVAQNVLLQATSLGLGAVPVGAFDDTALARALNLPAGEIPLYLIPVGHPAHP